MTLDPIPETPRRRRRLRPTGALSLAVLPVLAGWLGCGTSTNDVHSVAPGAPGSLVLMSLNIASGAGDRFRAEDNRVQQGAFVARTAAAVVAFQEVDVGTDRSGNADTAERVAVAVSPGFGTCSFVIGAPPHLRSDGTRLARCTAGAVVFGVAFRGDDPFDAASDGTPSGIRDADGSLNPTGVDRSADAFYGNAMLVRAPWEVEDAYTVALPIEASGPSAPTTLLDRLGREGSNGDALAGLAAHNQETRSRRGIEPRSALVVRVRKSDTKAISAIATHLESAGPPELRKAQLEAVLAIARAERHNGDRVVVMGDFNMPPSDAEASMVQAGFVRAAAPPDGTVEADQIWAGSPLVVEGAARAPTEGVSDHPYAAIAAVR